MGISAPYLGTKIPFRKINTGTAERLMVAYQEFTNACNADEKDRTRLYNNFKMYWGVDYGQWNDEVVAILLNEERHPMTLNLLSQKINTLAGALLANQLDVQFIPIDGSKTSLTQSFHDIYLSDKSVKKWDISALTALKYGLIYQGVEQMFEDKDSYDDTDGSIKFRTMQPGHVIFSPNWKTDDAVDCDKAWVIAYRSVREIADLYGTTMEELRTEIALTRANGQSFYGTPIDLGKDVAATYEGVKKVIECHEMRQVKTVRLLDYSKGPNGLAFPIMDPKKDKDYLRSWGDANKVDWSCVTEIPYKDRILNIFTFCPEISFNRNFEDRPGDIQIRRLDLFPYAADRLNGKNRGVIDVCTDTQQSINKRQSQKEHMINSAANGGMLLNENLTGGDTAKMQRIKDNKNNPAFIEDVDLDGVTKPYVVMKESAYDAALFEDEQLLIDILDLITPVPAAMSSRTEGSKESGILFQSKIAIAEVGMKTLYEGVKQHQLDKASAYYLQSQKTYRDKYKRFYKPDNSGYIEINKKVPINGRVWTFNNISELPRCHIIIKEDPNGLIQRHMARVGSTEMMNVIPQELALLRTWFALRMAKTVEGNDEEMKELDVIARMEMLAAGLIHKNKIAQTIASTDQAEMMTMQIDQQMEALAQQLGIQQGAPVEDQMTPDDQMAVAPDMPMSPEDAGEMGAEGMLAENGEQLPVPETTMNSEPDLGKPTVGLLSGVTR